MAVVGWMAAMLLSGAITPEPKACFDWVVVGELKRQVYIGASTTDERYGTSGGAFAWEVDVDQAVVGERVPQRLNLRLTQETGLPRRYWDGIIIFLRKPPGKRATVVRWAPMDQALDRAAWPGRVASQAETFGLQRCRP